MKAFLETQLIAVTLVVAALSLGTCLAYAAQWYLETALWMVNR